MNRLLAPMLTAFLTFAPFSGYAQSSSDANLLFALAIEIYSAAQSASSPERTALLQQVDALLDQITEEHPDSIPAQFIADGRQLGPIDLDVVLQAVAGSDSVLPEPVSAAVSRVAQTACANKGGNCAREVADGLTEFVLRISFDDSTKHAKEQIRWLFSNPGQITTDVERLQVFEEMIEDEVFFEELVRRVDERVLENVENIAREASADVAKSIVTSLSAELLAQHYESEGQSEAADFTRTWFEPLVDITLIVEGAAAATTTSAGVGAGVIWAKNAYAFVQLGRKQIEAEGSGATRDERLAQLASDIGSINKSLLTRRLTGPMFAGQEGKVVTDQMAETLRQVLQDNYELQRFWLSSNDAILLDTFDFVLQRAKDAALLLDKVADAIAVDPGQPTGTEHANSTNALPEKVGSRPNMARSDEKETSPRGPYLLSENGKEPTVDALIILEEILSPRCTRPCAINGSSKAYVAFAINEDDFDKFDRPTLAPWVWQVVRSETDSRLLPGSDEALVGRWENLVLIMQSDCRSAECPSAIIGTDANRGFAIEALDSPLFPLAQAAVPKYESTVTTSPPPSAATAAVAPTTKPETEFPKYEGVYARLRNGQFVPLRRYDGRKIWIKINRPNTFNLFPEIESIVLSAMEYGQLQGLRANAIESFIVLSKTLKISSLNTGGLVSDYFLPENERLLLMGGDGPSMGNYNQSKHFIMSSNWGYQKDNFKVAFFDQFTTELQPNFNPAGATTVDERRTNDHRIPAYFSVLVLTDGFTEHYYPFITDRQMQNAVSNSEFHSLASRFSGQKLDFLAARNSYFSQPYLDSVSSLSK